MSSFNIEQLERWIAGAQFLAFLPSSMHHLVVGLSRSEFEASAVVGDGALAHEDSSSGSDSDDG